jgi:hypothetical protein
VVRLDSTPDLSSANSTQPPARTLSTSLRMWWLQLSAQRAEQTRTHDLAARTHHQCRRGARDRGGRCNRGAARPGRDIDERRPIDESR